MRRILTRVWLAVLMLIPVSARGQGLDDALKAWSARDIDTVAINWTERVTVSLRTITGALPSTDVELVRKCNVELDGAQMRYTRSGLDWQPMRKRFEDETYVSAFNGSLARNYSTNNRDGRSPTVHPVGFIEQDNPEVHANSALAVILLAFRANSKYDLNLVGKKPTDSLREQGDETIDGKICVRLEQTVNALVRTLYVDPSQAFTVRRCRLEFQGDGDRVPVSEWNVRYRKDKESGHFAPSSWTCDHWVTVANEQKVGEHIDVVVTSTRFGQKTPASRFDLEFPVGTVVRDTISDTDYLVRANGAIRPILREERRRGADYDDFVASDSGKAKL